MIQKVKISENMTIAQAKDILRPMAKEGFICPCCNQPAKIYKRALTSAMAYALILIYHQDKNIQRVGKMMPVGGGYMHLENFFKQKKDINATIRGDAPKLRFWNFIEPMDSKRDDGNPNNGMYRITAFGKAFVENVVKVQSHCNIYNNRMLGWAQDAKPIGIVDALKKKFNYNELMNDGKSENGGVQPVQGRKVEEGVSKGR